MSLPELVPAPHICVSRMTWVGSVGTL